MSPAEERIRNDPLAAPRDAAAWATSAAPDRHAFEWGLASLLIGLTSLLVGGTALLVWGSVVGVHERRWDWTSLFWTCIGLIVAEFAVVALTIMGVVFGLRGLSHARRHGSPRALPLAGVVVGLVVILFWVMILVASFGTMAGMLRSHRPGLYLDDGLRSAPLPMLVPDR
jgi:hypothetical protein